MIYFIIGNGNICFESHLEIMFLCFQIFLFYISCSTSGSWFMVFLKILVEDIVHSYTVSYNYLWSMSFPCCRDRMNVNPFFRVYAWVPPVFHVMARLWCSHSFCCLISRIIFIFLSLQSLIQREWFGRTKRQTVIIHAAHNISNLSEG